MQSTDLPVLTNLAPVAKALLEKAGFKVDMQSMDWQTLVARRAKKDPPNTGGWNAFLTSWVSADILNPVVDQLPQRHLRQGDVRLAVRSGDREAARRLRHARPIRPSRRRSPRPCRCARSQVADARLRSASGTGRRAMRKNVERHAGGAGAVFWNIEMK